MASSNPPPSSAQEVASPEPVPVTQTEPASVESSTSAQQPALAENSEAVAQPATAEEPASVPQPAPIQKAATTAEPTTATQPAAAAQPAPTQQAASTQLPTATPQQVPAQQPAATPQAAAAPQSTHSEKPEKPGVLQKAPPTPQHPPQPAQPTATPVAARATSPPPSKNLRSWWRGLKKGDGKNQDTHVTEPSAIFGVPLRQSIGYANVAISLVDAEGKSYIYGYVPIVVAKCGVYLKEKATTVEGIFRLSGSEKRIKELKTIFDSPDRYGKGLDWDGYTVHDAANVFRRYLNQLPEPIVPLDLYDRFREPLRGHALHAVGDQEADQTPEDFDLNKTIATYQKLITELPPLNRQLLLYILDLLAVFASKSDENRMTSQNLSAIFQPGILSHPNHDMAPAEYRLSQDVLVFLIENQDHFLIGMRGTAADEQTVQHVKNGSTPPVAQGPVNGVEGNGE